MAQRHGYVISDELLHHHDLSSELLKHNAHLRDTAQHSNKYGVITAIFSFSHTKHTCGTQHGMAHQETVRRSSTSVHPRQFLQPPSLTPRMPSPSPTASLSLPPKHLPIHSLLPLHSPLTRTPESNLPNRARKSAPATPPFLDNAAAVLYSTHPPAPPVATHLPECPPANDGQWFKVVSRQACALQPSEVTLSLLQLPQDLELLILRQTLPPQLRFKCKAPACVYVGWGGRGCVG
jgi:hypothetical protein